MAEEEIATPPTMTLEDRRRELQQEVIAHRNNVRRAKEHLKLFDDNHTLELENIEMKCELACMKDKLVQKDKTISQLLSANNIDVVKDDELERLKDQLKQKDETISKLTATVKSLQQDERSETGKLLNDTTTTELSGGAPSADAVRRTLKKRPFDLVDDHGSPTTASDSDIRHSTNVVESSSDKENTTDGHVVVVDSRSSTLTPSSSKNLDDRHSTRVVRPRTLEDKQP